MNLMADEYKICGYELVRKEVKPVGTGGGIYLPKAWIGETVAVVRLGEIWTVDPWDKICDCDSEYDALSRLDLLQQLEPDKEFSIQEMSVCLNRNEPE